MATKVWKTAKAIVPGFGTATNMAHVMDAAKLAKKVSPFIGVGWVEI